MGVSIWIVPPPEAAKNLKTLMRIPPALGSLPYHVPEFDPHITISTFPNTMPHSVLHSAIDVAAREMSTFNEATHTETSISGTLAGISLNIAYDALAIGDHFFRSVFLDITPSTALVAFRARILEALETSLLDTVHASQSPRFPHMSLFYIPEEHAMYRERLCHALRKRYAAGCSDNRVVFDLPSDAGAAGFDAYEAWIVLCDGPTEEWKVLDKVSLISSSSQ